MDSNIDIVLKLLNGEIVHLAAASKAVVPTVISNFLESNAVATVQEVYGSPTMTIDERVKRNPQSSTASFMRTVLFHRELPTALRLPAETKASYARMKQRQTCHYHKPIRCGGHLYFYVCADPSYGEVNTWSPSFGSFACQLRVDWHVDRKNSRINAFVRNWNMDIALGPGSKKGYPIANGTLLHINEKPRHANLCIPIGSTNNEFFTDGKSTYIEIDKGDLTNVTLWTLMKRVCKIAKVARDVSDAVDKITMLGRDDSSSYTKYDPLNNPKFQFCNAPLRRGNHDRESG